MIVPNPFRFLSSAFRIVRGALRGDDPLAPQNVVADRQLECEICEWRIIPTNQCLKCSCFLSVKQLFSAERCPVGNWRA